MVGLGAGDTGIAVSENLAESWDREEKMMKEWIGGSQKIMWRTNGLPLRSTG